MEAAASLKHLAKDPTARKQVIEAGTIEQLVSTGHASWVQGVGGLMLLLQMKCATLSLVVARCTQMFIPGCGEPDQTFLRPRPLPSYTPARLLCTRRPCCCLIPPPALRGRAASACGGCPAPRCCSTASPPQASSPSSSTSCRGRSWCWSSRWGWAVLLQLYTTKSIAIMQPRTLRAATMHTSYLSAIFYCSQGTQRVRRHAKRLCGIFVAKIHRQCNKDVRFLC